METLVILPATTILELQKFTSKDKTKPTLHSIRFEETFAYATNSYTLVKKEVQHLKTEPLKEPFTLDFTPILKMLVKKDDIVICKENGKYFVKNWSNLDLALPVKTIKGMPDLKQVTSIMPKENPKTFKLGIDTTLLPKGKFIFSFNPDDNLSALTFQMLDDETYQGMIMPIRIK